ncbi:MAG: glycoside hydrolase family 3 N-terminal domain-containing protein [Verrucomicrobiales bacterium]|nr:glycoside hydrolase family 3 N-terminal domain-containing protein [Verrucomicrobiota bacterium JB025]
MKLRLATLAAILAALLAAPLASRAAEPYKNPTLPVEQRVQDLLSRMTLEEKVLQMRMFHANRGIRFTKDDEMQLKGDTAPRLTNGIGGIKNPGESLTPLRAANLNNQLQKHIIDHSRLGIPTVFVTESYNGVDAHGCTRFGRPVNLAASWDTDLTRDVWSVIGREARLRGMHMCHSPEADIIRDPRFGRMSESLGEDTYLTTRMITASVLGVQGGYGGAETDRNTTHIGAVVKHFAGYAQVQGGTNFAAIEISPRVLIDEIFPPFKAAIQQAHALGVMASHGDINGVASHANPWLLTETLRDQWGFNGYVVSDANDVARLHFFMKVAETPEAAAELGLKAGVDLDLYSDDAYVFLPEMAKKDPGLIPFIDRSTSNILRVKFILGLFDQPYTNLDEVERGVRSESSLKLARTFDEESIILLKNQNNQLPLARNNGKKIALLGPLLAKDTKAAFEKIAGPGVTFVADQGFRLTDDNRQRPTLNTDTEAGVEKLVNLAKDADLSVLFVGGDFFTSKEAFFGYALGDRESIDPVGQQDDLVQRVKALGKPVIVVLKHRRTLSINVIAEQADAIVDCWDLSEFGEESIAKVLFGDVCPSGKLPVTVPRSIGRLPFHYSQKEINDKKGYLFTEPGPLYPFGYGLSYTTFAYDKLQISDQEMARDGKVVVSVEVTNTGNREAKEVVQMYLKDEFGQVMRPNKELKGFEKVALKPGETKRVEFTITPDMLVFTGLEMKPVLEAGDYRVMVGPSSANTQAVSFRLN